MAIRKTPTLAEIVAALDGGEVQLPPLSLSVEETAFVRPKDGGTDAVAVMAWGERRFRFVVACQRLWTPKAMTELIARMKRYSLPPGTHRLVVVPYLPEERLADLQAEGVSGIDLCGNGVVSAPGEVFVYRTGRPNGFRSPATIKNVFRGDSSLVGRAFLAVPEFASVQEARREIGRLGGNLTLSTVSKVCKSLEELLVIERRRAEGGPARNLRLLQPGKLLDLLAENYVPPPVKMTVVGKAKLHLAGLTEVLTSLPDVRVVRTGFGSVGHYAVMGVPSMEHYYCTDAGAILDALGDAFEPADRFADMTLVETQTPAVYFDGRPGLVASPVQTYLELMAGDKRSRETAQQVRKVILADLGRAAGEETR